MAMETFQKLKVLVNDEVDNNRISHVFFRLIESPHSKFPVLDLMNLLGYWMVNIYMWYFYCSELPELPVVKLYPIFISIRQCALSLN